MADIAALIARHDRLRADRGTFDSLWQEVADYIIPSREFTQRRGPGEKRMTKIFDTTAILACEQLAGALHGMLTSPAVRWFALRSADGAGSDEARAMVGARFRAQGRSAAHGLDCVGLVAAAYAVAGRSLEVPEGYPLRGWRGERIVAGLERAGFVAAVDPLRMGDVALIALAAGQFHLGLLAPGRVVHARGHAVGDEVKQRGFLARRRVLEQLDQLGDRVRLDARIDGQHVRQRHEQRDRREGGRRIVGQVLVERRIDRVGADRANLRCGVVRNVSSAGLFVRDQLASPRHVAVC